MQVYADQCYFRFKNSSSKSIKIALRPQLHLRVPTKREFAVTPRSYHLGEAFVLFVSVLGIPIKHL